jgi:hypothetical protein
MTSVRMVQMSVDHIVDVVSMRHRLVTTAISVYVPALVPSTAVRGRALRRVRGADLEHAFVHMVFVSVVQVAVVQVVDVVVVTNRSVSARGAVHVVVTWMSAVCHVFFFLLSDASGAGSSA